jgi:hypothetical protein
VKTDKIIMLATFCVISLQGCRWNDDFRSREQPSYLQQPQYVEPLPQPTLNRESEDYEGDDTHKTEDDERNTKMPQIDGRSPIPPVPRYPAGL